VLAADTTRHSNTPTLTLAQPAPQPAGRRTSRTGFAPPWNASRKPAENKFWCVRKWADRNDRHEVYMRLVLNLLWLVLSGFWMFLAYIFVGVLWCITVIGIPFGIASFRIGLFALWPFGRTVVKKPRAGTASGIGNVIWFILSGVWLAIGHAVTGALLCITVIGIPLGLANFKLIPVSLFPLGKDIVSTKSLDNAFANGVVVGPTA
jgi:uncharacterized membrane protein YccF (DUF307 family)